MEQREEVVSGVGGQGRGQPRPLEGNRGVERAEAAVADLSEEKANAR